MYSFSSGHPALFATPDRMPRARPHLFISALQYHLLILPTRKPRYRRLSFIMISLF